MYRWMGLSGGVGLILLAVSAAAAAWVGPPKLSVTIPVMLVFAVGLAMCVWAALGLVHAGRRGALAARRTARADACLQLLSEWSTLVGQVPPAEEDKLGWLSRRSGTQSHALEFARRSVFRAARGGRLSSYELERSLTTVRRAQQAL